MEVTVRGKHVTVSDQVADRAKRKFAHLDHYLPLLRDAVVEVDLAHERTKEPDGRYVVHVSVSGNGIHLRAEEHAARPEIAIDSAARVLTEQARRHKERLYDLVNEFFWIHGARGPVSCSCRFTIGSWRASHRQRESRSSRPSADESVHRQKLLPT